VQPFFVKIRNAEHRLLEGVETGDIGSKLGFNMKDNGFMRLNNLRAPKSCLLGRFYSINEAGDF
jgi:acyl-CoA oxidase